MNNIRGTPAIPQYRAIDRIMLLQPYAISKSWLHYRVSTSILIYICDRPIENTIVKIPDDLINR